MKEMNRFITIRNVEEAKLTCQTIARIFDREEDEVACYFDSTEEDYMPMIGDWYVNIESTYDRFGSSEAYIVIRIGNNFIYGEDFSKNYTEGKEMMKKVNFPRAGKAMRSMSDEDHALYVKSMARIAWAMRGEHGEDM